MLDILKLDADVTQEVEKDTLGGGGVLPTDIHDFTIKAAYLDAAKSKAVSLNLILESSTGRKLNVQEYITSGEAKGCKPYYEKDGKKFPLPGYSKMNTLCQLVTGNTIDKLNAEDKILKLYDYDAKGETNQTKKVITDLSGAKIQAGVFKIIENKRKNMAGPGEKADYQPTEETREINEVDKFFNEEGKTLEEVINNKDASFAEEWLKAHQGKTKDKTTKVAGGTTAGAPALGGATTAPLNFT
jgi:hypothetical protein